MFLPLSQIGHSIGDNTFASNIFQSIRHDTHKIPPLPAATKCSAIAVVNSRQQISHQAMKD